MLNSIYLFPAILQEAEAENPFVLSRSRISAVILSLGNCWTALSRTATWFTGLRWSLAKQEIETETHTKTLILETKPHRERERNVLFNDALNTFYLRLYGVRHMVKDHSDSEQGNPLLPHRLLLSINSKGSFICTIPQMGLHIPQPLLRQSWSTGWNEKWLQWVHPMKDMIQWPIAPKPHKTWFLKINCEHNLILMTK